MPIFTCAGCAAKDNHISSLQHQIQTLEKLVFPTRPTQDVTISEVESDALFEDRPLTPEDAATIEASNLLSGNYDNIEETY